MKLSTLYSAVLACTTLHIASISAQTNRIVLPAEADETFGDIRADLFANVVEQVYASSEFSEVGGSMVIQELAFRIDETGNEGFDAQVGQIKVYLQITPFTMDEIVQSGGAGHLGGIRTLVFSSINHKLSGSSQISSFPIRFPLETPFHYDQTRGHLVLTIESGSVWGTALSSNDAQEITFERGSLTYHSPRNRPIRQMIVTEFIYRSIAIRIVSALRIDNTLRLDVSLQGEPKTFTIESSTAPSGPFLPVSDAVVTDIDQDKKQVTFPVSKEREFFRVRAE